MKRFAGLVVAVLAVVPLLWAPASAAGASRVVLIGIPSLRWADVQPGRAPHLRRLAARSAVGLLSAKSIGHSTCPMDGWATVSSGSRAATNLCAGEPNVESDGQGAVVEDMPSIGRYVDSLGFPSRIGLLGDAVHRSGGCVSAAGPGAALGGADASGRIDRYSADPAAANVTDCAVTLVSFDDLVHREGERRRDATRRVDTAIGALLARIPEGTTVVVAGISDHWGVPRLRAVLASGTGFDRRSLGSASTRQPDVVILPDLTATVLDAAGIQAPDTLVGTPARAGGGPHERLGDEIRRLNVQAAEGEVLKRVSFGFHLGWVIALYTVYALGVVALRRRGRWLPAIRAAALAAAALPVSTYLVNLLPWAAPPWSVDPGAALVGGVLLCDALITTAVLAATRRRSALAPVLAVAGLSAAVPAADQLFGMNLQVNSLMGYSHLGGWRYFGMGNVGFAVLTTATLLAASVLAQRTHDRGRPGAALGVIAGLGACAALLDGLPLWGSDFGGMIAFIPGLAVTLLVASRRRISAVKLAVLAAVTAAVVLAVAYADSLRPAADRTHIGRFVHDLLNGDAGPVVARKLTVMTRSFTDLRFAPLALTAVLFLVLLLRGPAKDLLARAPLFQAGLLGAVTTLVVGTLANDSGVSILTLGLTVLVPLTLAATTRNLASEPAAPAPKPRGPVP
ncbi:hypothetical protein EDD29_3553 [Actinocorallia herbida]|uniref:Uncharacterized protein n=1 Tax=Actinocorallia herbida TaxID=58109 RepID=A0A3N1CXN0_9ACTN|nr:hypothetical protein [Actinocorallia herbida]ROO85996.1 hypothetical protein EDD29_3553 [Actinocorallia herbida]